MGNRFETASILFSCILIIISIFAVSCAPEKGYAGPPLPRDKVAIIRGDSVTVHRVDSVRRGGFGVDGVAVLPGAHKLELYEAGGNITVLSFTAEAGSDYLVRAAEHQRGCFWIEDVKRSRQVSRSLCG